VVWITFGFLAIIVVAAVIAPLTRSRGSVPARASFDRAIYRDQLKEVARDVERGLLSETEAASARLEIERRLLATAAETPPSAKTPAQATGMSRVATATLAAAVILGAVAVYLVHGAPQIPDQPYLARAAERSLIGTNGDLDLDKTIAAIEARLKIEPGNAEGWLLLARTQAARSHWQESAAAYREALTLTKQRPDVASAYGEMLVMAADEVVTPAARDAFKIALARDPKNARARYYLALADAQTGNAQAAIDAWQRLLAESSADAPWISAVQERIAETAKAAGLAVAAAPPAPRAPGHSGDDLAAAAQLSPEQRTQMVRGMVDRLAAKLQEQPDDLEGWLRLGRSYEVLDESTKAADAYAHAAALKPDDASILVREVDALTAGRAPTDPVPQAAIDVLKRLEALDPSEPRALWFLGLAAAQDHRIDDAKADWEKLLTVLPADSNERKTVSEALAALSR